MRWAPILTLLVLTATPAVAGPPDASCSNGANGCFLESDVLVFALGDPSAEVVGTIENCTQCTDIGNGSFELSANVSIVWGPYDSATGCSPGDDETNLSLFKDVMVESLDGGGNPVYEPRDPLQVFPVFPNASVLDTSCVSVGNLRYLFRRIDLTGRDGAVTPTLAVGDNAELEVPGSVRAYSGGAPTTLVPLESIALAQDLTFVHDVDYAPSSSLRYRPEGLPFRLGPDRVTYTERQVEFTSDPAAGPTPYEPEPLQGGNLAGNQIVECDSNKPDPGVACTTPNVTNAAYLDHPSWEPVGTSRFDLDGFDADLALRAGSEIVWQPMFPRGVWVRVLGPGSLSVTDGRIRSGEFERGDAWSRMQDGDLCGTAEPRDETYALRTGTDRPQIGLDGRLLAGIEDLINTAAVEWSVNQVLGVECGTLFVPPVVHPEDPGEAWNRSAVPTVLDRGVYAGVNYNRDHVCHDAFGTPLEKLCATDADCDVASGETCQDGGFAPLCPDLDGTQTGQWLTDIEGIQRAFLIFPAIEGQGDREMAFVLRRSGVTGVFDAGDEPFTLQPANGYVFDFETYGLAFRQSRTGGADTIVRGSMPVDWPANTTLPFEEMSVCDCGSMDAADSPDALVENELEYWDATFYPEKLDFTSAQIGTSDPCPPPDQTGCTQAAQSTAVCVQALTPIPRILPDPSSRFPLFSDGNTGVFEPFSGPDVDFDEDVIGGQPPYDLQLTDFRLNDWVPSILRDDVVECTLGSACEPYGYYDVNGELAIPYFGLTASGIQIGAEDRAPGDPNSPLYHPANLHEQGNLAVSSVVVERALAANSVVPRFRVDYFSPDATGDPNDGDDRAFRGRGKLFAFGREQEVNLGAVRVAAGAVLTPGTWSFGQADLGPAAALRLWGATDPNGPADDPDKHRRQLESIIEPNLVLPEAPTYDAVLDGLASLRGYDAWNLPAPSTLKQDLFDTGLLESFSGHDHYEVAFDVGGAPSPPVIGRRVAGFVTMSGAIDPEQVEGFEVVSDQSSGGEFYAFDASRLTVERHAKQGKMPITTVSRESQAGSSPNMALPGEQSIPFPGGAGGADGFVDSSTFFPGIQWDFDYDVNTSTVPPTFDFNSLTGTLDLTAGGLSGMAFDKLGATLKFWDDGDWYFSAGLKVAWNGYSVSGDILLGNTRDMTPLWDIDKDVAQFLSGIDRFEGAYVGAGMSTKLFDAGCPLSVGAGVDLAGWYVQDAFGGKVRGYLTGRGACLVSVRGDLTLIGGEVQDRFKIQGKFWVAGGIGFCDPDGWDTPSDVLGDNACLSCVISARAKGAYPPKDLDLKLKGPKVRCSG